ncbi:MAG: relaxase MobL [Oscillospiraceae bacterium]|jgi:hypothetical protein|nr:relaxase MobL [Oscillospiraceae bacterium]
MARLIFKCPYLKGGGATVARRGNYVRYIATRDGAEYVDDNKSGLPATFNQRQLIEKILKDFPDSVDSFEYEDYSANPTRGNASEFITAALEHNIAAIGKRSNYVEYIAKRPRAERLGSHGLFTSADTPVVLSQVADEAANHSGNLWLPIISLRREDAERLGYDSADRWRDFLRSQANDIATAMKISPERFKWYAAFHDEGHHPHIHMVAWSTEPSEGFLTKDGIRQIKSGLATRIFKDDLLHVYELQTRYRSELGEQARARMAELIAQMQIGELTNERIEQLIIELSTRLKKLKGKKQYGYLPAPLKNIVDAITDELCADERVAECYRLWCEARLDVLRTYTQNPPHPGPLSKQPDLKRIRNIVIELALDSSESREQKAELPEQDNNAQMQNEELKVKNNGNFSFYTFHFSFGTRLLRSLGNIFQDNPPIPKVGSATERKLLRKLRQKKIAQGHAADDREQQQSF